MSSSDPKDTSPPLQNKQSPTSIQEITEKLELLFEKLSDAKNDPEKASKLTPQPADKDGDSKPTADTVPNPLDKVCNELNYLIRSFKKLEGFETDLSEPLSTLQKNVEDILADLVGPQANSDNVREMIARNLNVLRSNITKVKARIPLQHQAFSSISGGRFLQTTNASKDVGMLPNPYEADGIFTSGTFLKELEAHYSDMDLRHKLCLLCFAIFPENAVVKQRLLRFWWEGERLISKTSPEDKPSVKEILKTFVDEGFIEPVTKRSRSQATSYKMHPIIRCLVIKFAQEANFFSFDPKGYPNKDFFKSKKLCLVKSEGPSWWSKDVPLPKESDPKSQGSSGVSEKDPAGPNAKSNQQGKNSKEDVKLNQEVKSPGPSRKSNKDPPRKKFDKNAKPNKQEKSSEENEKERVKLETEREKWEKERVRYLDNLQTLFNVSKQFPDLRKELFSKMKNIRVLYLGRWERGAERHMEVENTDFLDGLKNMNKLRFFSLQGISGIKELPKSLGKLFNLRILDLRACHNLEKLPKEVGALKMLTHLDLSECYLLENIPKELSHLPKLKVLKGFLISKNSKCSLENLTKLSNLEKLSIKVNNDEFSIYKEDNYTLFSKFEKLEKLKIAWGAGGEGAKTRNGKESKTQDSETLISGARKTIGKLKIWPWGGVHGEGSSKSVPENKGAAPTEKPGGVEKSQVTGNGEAKNQTSDATPAKQLEKKDKKMKLRKLDLQCYPQRELPVWLVPGKLESLERLYIRGGRLSELGPVDKQCGPGDKQCGQVDKQRGPGDKQRGPGDKQCGPVDKQCGPGDKQWNVKILRLKYLLGVKMNWKELKMQFPKLEYLEKVNCPQIAFCPCDASGVWEKKGSNKQPPTNGAKNSLATSGA